MHLNNDINWFSLAGLLLDMIGVVLLFFNGLPSPIDEAQDSLLISSRLTEKMEKSIRIKAKAGLVCIFCGFILQGVGVIFSN